MKLGCERLEDRLTPTTVTDPLAPLTYPTASLPPANVASDPAVVPDAVAGQLGYDVVMLLVLATPAGEGEVAGGQDGTEQIAFFPPSNTNQVSDGNAVLPTNSNVVQPTTEPTLPPLNLWFGPNPFNINLIPQPALAIMPGLDPSGPAVSPTPTPSTNPLLPNGSGLANLFPVYTHLHWNSPSTVQVGKPYVSPFYVMTSYNRTVPNPAVNHFGPTTVGGTLTGSLGGVSGQATYDPNARLTDPTAPYLNAELGGYLGSQQSRAQVIATYNTLTGGLFGARYGLPSDPVIIVAVVQANPNLSDPTVTGNVTIPNLNITGGLLWKPGQNELGIQGGYNLNQPGFSATAFTTLTGTGGQFGVGAQYQWKSFWIGGGYIGNLGNPPAQPTTPPGPSIGIGGSF